MAALQKGGAVGRKKIKIQEGGGRHIEKSKN